MKNNLLFISGLAVLVLATYAKADDVKYETSPYCKGLLENNDTVRYERNCKVKDEPIKGCIPTTPCEAYDPLQGGN